MELSGSTTFIIHAFQVTIVSAEIRVVGRYQLFQYTDGYPLGENIKLCVARSR
jgi:hypothetical protein